MRNTLARNRRILSTVSDCFWWRVCTCKYSCHSSWFSVCRPRISLLMVCWWRLIASMSCRIYAMSTDPSCLSSSCLPPFLRVTRHSRSGWSRWKCGLANCQISSASACSTPWLSCGTLWKPYIFSWRTNDEKLLCLKNLGSTSLENSSCRSTIYVLLLASGIIKDKPINDAPSDAQWMSVLVAGSLTMLKSLLRKAGTLLFAAGRAAGTEPAGICPGGKSDGGIAAS